MEELRAGVETIREELKTLYNSNFSDQEREERGRNLFRILQHRLILNYCKKE